MVAFQPMLSWFVEETRSRRIAVAIVIYLLTTAVYFALASPEVLTEHTQWNHFALLAESWLQGRLDLGGTPPGYAGRNDFAQYQGDWYVTFPPFPAVLLLPAVAYAGSAVRVQDGQFFIWLAGIAPAVLFLVLEKLRRTGRGSCGIVANTLLSLLFAFGTVYFFTAVQGTVWFAAHVVGVALAALYVLFALDAERPLLAGLMIGLAFMTRAPLVFAVPLFAFEAVRRSLRPSEKGVLPGSDSEAGSAHKVPAAPDEQLALPWSQGDGAAERARGRGRGWLRRQWAPVQSLWARLDGRRLLGLGTWFALPIIAVLGVAMWHNAARFDAPFDFGYQHLVVAWKPRIEKWGLFHYHYLAKNLGALLTNLPWVTPQARVPFKISGHGLALWVTSPMYLWLLWPRRKTLLHVALWVTVIAVALPTLFYQNTGWVQFGYRFSNDYAVFLFALLAIAGYRLRALFMAAAVWALTVNSFGAVTFGKSHFKAFYFQDNAQRVFYQPH